LAGKYFNKSVYGHTHTYNWRGKERKVGCKRKTYFYRLSLRLLEMQTQLAEGGLKVVVAGPAD